MVKNRLCYFRSKKVISAVGYTVGETVWLEFEEEIRKLYLGAFALSIIHSGTPLAFGAGRCFHLRNYSEHYV